MLHEAQLAIKKKKYHKVVEICEKIILVSPDQKQANYLLGLAYKDMGQKDKALLYLQKLLNLDPENGSLYPIIGDLYLQKKQPEEALQYYLTAIKRGIKTDQLYTVTGVLYKEKGDFDKALEFYQKALDLKPDATTVLQEIGMIHMHNGNRDAVVKAMRRILEIDPKAYSAYYMLARSQKHLEYDDTTKKMEELFSSSDTPDEGRMYLGYGLGKIYEELGEYDRAFESLEKANKIKRSTSSFSIDDAIRKFDALKKVFNKPYIDHLGETGVHDKTPIFIVGMPRSGTSLAEQILSSHPSIYGAGELLALPGIVVKYIKNSPSLSPEIYTKMGEEYIKAIREIESTAEYITDKQPANYKNIPYIRLALPEAKIIHCVRDPMDTCFSNYKNYFSQGRSMSNDLIKVGQNFKLYQDLMQHYHKLFQGKIYDLVYEDLVADQEGETKKLLEFLNIPWDESCLSHHKTKRTVRTMSSMQVREPVYKDSVELWRHYEKHLQPLKKILEGDRPMTSEKRVVTINGESYDIDTLSELTKSQLQNIRFAEAELKRLQDLQSLTQTALNSYKKALISTLPNQQP